MGVGWQEIIVVLVIVLLIFGPKRLPEIGRSLGKGIKEFKKSTTELQEHLTVEDTEPPKVEKAQATEKAAEPAAAEPVAAAEPATAPEPKPAPEPNSAETKTT